MTAVRRRFVLVVTVWSQFCEGMGRSAGSKADHDQACFGVSVLVIGNRLGLQISKPDDNHVNAKW